MPTVTLSYRNYDRTSTKNKSEYYLKLIIRQTLECLNSNCISYVNFKNPRQNIKTDASIVLSTTSEPKLIPSMQGGIQIFFIPGNPKSKRLAGIMAENLRNIYYKPTNVTIHPKQKSQLSIPKNNEANVYLSFGFENNKKDMEWLKENTEEISQNIIMSLTEYFGLPFTPCLRPLMGIAKSDSNIFSKPSTKSKTIGFIAKNKKTIIQGQWEDWYVIGKNLDLGYIPSRFIDAI